MSTINNIKSILETQKESLEKLHDEVQILSNSDMAKENTEMKVQIKSLNETLASTKSKLTEVSQENKGLKNALYQQIYNEKMSILNMSSRKLDIYFKSTCEVELNRLSQFESDSKKKINNVAEILKENRVDTTDEIYSKLDELKRLLDIKVTEIKEKYAKEKGAYSYKNKEEYERLKAEQITDEQIVSSVKKSNWEAFIGQNIINKVGIFLVIIGVIAASQVTYFKLPDMLKCILIFVLGGGMLVAGEFLNRKKPNIFSMGISAGGVAILYVGMSVSYFMYGILAMYPAIILCILITSVSFLLSKRYDSATIAAFSLVGGYLPIFSVTGGISLIWGAMVYFIILNLLMLSLSFHRKWTACYFIGLVLNSLGTFYLILNISIRADNPVNGIITILYIVFAFGIYTAIPVISSYTQRLKFKKSDIVLMAINTLLSSVIMYFTFYVFNFEDYNGVLAVIFALVYLFVGTFVEKKLAEEKKASALFYLTGFAFVVLLVPIQFGKVWLSLGWLAEGIALVIYGILNDLKSFKKGGFIIGAFCLAAFMVFDTSNFWDSMFAYKYFAITAGSLLVLGAYIHKRALSSRFETIYKYASIVNTWIFCLYIIYIKLPESISTQFFNEYYLTGMLAIVVSFAMAFILPRIKILSDQGVKIISIVITFFSIIWLLSINALGEPIKMGGNLSINQYALLAAVIAATGICSLVSLYDMVKSTIIDRKLSIEWLPLIVSGYFVILLTQNLTVQFHLSFTNMFISIIYAVTAFVWIVLGFIKRFTLIRKFGLGLSIFSVVKLFMLDLSDLTESNRIVSYFALGISLIAISFVYQYFSKRLEIKGGIVDNE